MKIELKNFLFEQVTKLATEENVKVYVIGGFVRDYFLKRPSKDIDFVIIGNGIDFANKLALSLKSTSEVIVFKNFGTAMFKYNELELEFVGARKESYDRNSRKPIVENGTLQEDQDRRDFTINALAISLNKENLFDVLDSFGGLSDLENKIIKTPLDPDITFSDDPLRIMRAIRFATQLGFEIHPETYQAIIKNNERIKIISSERIVDELHKIILAKQPSLGFKLLYETGVLEIIFPELYRLVGVSTENNISHKDNFWHTLKVLDNISENTKNLWLRWAALLHDIGKPISKRFIDNTWTFHGHQTIGAEMVPNIFRRLKMPLNEKMKYVQKLVFLHHRPIALANEPITDSAVRRLVYDAGDDVNDLFTLTEADITTQIEYKQKKFLKNYELLRQRILQVSENDFIRNWQPPIDGNEIMRLFNLKPSKIVGVMKEAVKDAILDGKVENNYEDAYKFLQDLFIKYNKN